MQEELRVKFHGRLLVLMSILALFLVGCKDTQRVEKAEMDREALVTSVSQAADQLVSKTQTLKSENDRLRNQVQTLQTQIATQEKTLEDLTYEVRKLSDSVTGAKTAIQQERASAEKGDGINFLGYLLIVIIVIVIIYLLYRFLRPSPIEDEDEEDFSTFDDDFGFEDEEDFADEGKEDDDQGKK